jgi:hypothetical protein
VSGVEMTLRGSVCAFCVAVVAPLALLVAAWGSPARAGDVWAAPAQPTHCASATGQVYAVNVVVEHKNGKVELKQLFLVCQPSHFVKIVDWTGRAYDDLNGFRAHNHVFSKDDKISVPRGFPSVDATASPAFGPALSGHTGGSSTWWWWLIGGFVVLIPVAGVWLWPRR